MTKTDNLLKLIILIRGTSDCKLKKKSLMSLLGKSRAQTYKILAEFSDKTETRPPVFIETEEEGVKYVGLTPDFQ
ncbi:hypothetical protein N9948_02025 [bacterium]|nr:hypothetical protein [bacterium]